MWIVQMKDGNQYSGKSISFKTDPAMVWLESVREVERKATKSIWYMPWKTIEFQVKEAKRETRRVVPFADVKTIFWDDSDD